MRRLMTAAMSGAVALAALVTGPTAGAEAAATSHCAAPLLAAPVRGSDAASRLGGSLTEAAARNGVTGQQLRDQLHRDHTLWLDRCGKRFFVDSDLGAATAATASVAPSASSPYDQTFRLHSRPGSARTIYLDFTGYVVSATAWNTSYNSGQSFTAPGYDTDGDPSTFSAAEQDVVQAVWASVAEDYAPFDVDVTTEEPSTDALTRTSTSDTTYGTRAVITSLAGPAPGNTCGCGGIAYVGSFNAVGGATYQPAFVFLGGVGTGWKGIAEAAAHEVGHNLGLSHDGITTSTGLIDYYSGAAPWAPIMGAGYYHPVTEWSRGEYAGANNTQDDLAVIAAHGANPVADDYPDGTAGAPVVADGTPVHGVISTASDTDWFRFSAGGGATRIDVAPADLSPDLDMALTVYAADGTTVVARSAPVTQEVSATTASGLGASWTSPNLPAGTYYAAVDGVGTGDPSQPGGYSDYASLGAYTLTLTSSGPLAVTSTALPRGEDGTAYSAQVTTIGGTAPRTVTAGGLPTGLSMSADGAIAGTPTAAPATYPVTVTVTDATGATAASDLDLTIAPALVAGAGAAREAVIGAAYADARTATGGVAPYTWSATGLPAGLAIGASTGAITGRPTAASTGTPVVTVADAAGARSSVHLALVVRKPLVVTTGALPGATRGRAYRVRVGATGGDGHYRWTLGGALPSGLTLGADGTVSGTVRSTASTGSVTLRVTDAAGRTATRRVTLPVAAAPRVTTTALPSGRRGGAYAVVLRRTGGTGALRWSVARGALPPGVALHADGTLQGRPQRRGAWTVTVRVTDRWGASATRSWRLVVR